MSINNESDKQSRRAVLASYVGTTLEYYDFLLYGIAAAIVFPKIFFVSMDPLAASLSSFATFAVGYFARPLGAIIFGHYGDRLGRKNILVITLMMMGISSCLIGLIPSYHQIGLGAPILLVILRIMQGFAMGGEWGGATLMSMEHAKPTKRGLAVGIALSGGPTGAVLGTLVMTPFSMLPSEEFLSWGWRVPFLISAVLMVVGLFIRKQVTESPEYEAMRKTQSVRQQGTAPLMHLLKHHKADVFNGVIGGLAPLAFTTFAAAFLMTYAVMQGHARSDVLIALTIANVIHIFTTPLFTSMSDRWGRTALMSAGTIAGIVTIWPIFLLVQAGTFTQLLIAMILILPVVQAMMGGTMATWIGEKFPANIRYSGISLTFQLASTIGAGLSPLAAMTILNMSAGNNPEWVAMFFAGVCAASLLAYIVSARSATQRSNQQPAAEVILKTSKA